MAKSNKLQKYQGLYITAYDYERAGDLEHPTLYSSLAEAEDAVEAVYFDGDEFMIYELVPVKRGTIVLDTRVEWNK